ncbi:phosphatidylinositol 5-phosphate 4-kinase type-2 beta isoformX1 [Tropilaelaps mercedesae]|uniref:Phosphatidylinositol 5-phosphate 4-kinase type-2 beta isoformX1 n=1 Tax=Tropilaelaps mercedesae TaxID=418985 RepID=A0A1V9X5X7_9ACAR|nr:phosphatidylinositol 5-phosphate 4-kinase type-2 beta isoformX1 [Tropilaelaps mercedesae]
MSSVAKSASRLKKKHLKPKQQKAKLFRANEPLLSVFMWGVNHTDRFAGTKIHKLLTSRIVSK